MLFLQHTIPWFLLASAAAAPGLAQDSPKFDVVSVKPCQEGAAQSPSGGRGGSAASGTTRFHLPCQTVKNLILQAYYAYADGRTHPPPFPPIEGGPGWIDSARYTIDAVADSAASRAVMNGPMLRALLEDRFQLKLHREMRDSPAYALVIAKGGAKLKPYHEGDCVDIGLVHPLSGPPPKVARGERPALCGSNRTHTNDAQVVWDIPGVSLDFFCRVFLGNAFQDRPVTNRTGLDGLYNIHLEFTPDEATPGPPDNSRAGNAAGAAAVAPGPSIFTALDEQLGLKLDPARAKREFLVVESIQRPSAN